MITKTGDLSLSTIIPAVVGAYRADSLRDEEKRAIIKEYGLPENSSLAARNAGRGALGGTLGALAGLGVGSTIGTLGGSVGRLAGGAFGGTLGIIGGTRYATDKYSRGRAQEILQRMRERQEREV